MATYSQNVSLTDYTADAADIERRRKYAEALQQQGFTPIEQQTAGGQVIPVSWTQGLAKALQAYSGRVGQEKATEDQKALGQKYQTDLTNTLMKANSAGMGRAESPYDATEFGGDAGMNPAVAPDRSAMARILMEHPATQPLGMAQMSKDMDTQQRSALLAQILGGGSKSPATGGTLSAAGAGSLFEGVPPQIIALMTSGDPELVKLGQTMMEANKGVAQRAGAPVVNPFSGRVIAQPTPAVPAGVQLNLGAGGPVASPVPGATAAMGGAAAATAGGTAAGKAPYNVSVVNTPGSPTLMTDQQQIEAATGRPMQVPGQPAAMPVPNQSDALPRPAAPIGAPRPTAPSAITPQRETDRLRILKEELKNFPNDPALLKEIAAAEGRPPGLALQDQGASAEQKSFGTERGQLLAGQPQATNAAKMTLANIDRLANVASELETHPGLNGIVGRVNQYSMLDVTDQTRAARGLQDTLVNQAATKALADMREASKTGGAVGNVTEKEWPILQQQLAALNAAQGTADYRVALKNIQNQMTGAATRIRQAYKDTYGEPLQFDPIPYERQGRGAGTGMPSMSAIDAEIARRQGRK